MLAPRELAPLRRARLCYVRRTLQLQREPLERQQLDKHLELSLPQQWLRQAGGVQLKNN